MLYVHLSIIRGLERRQFKMDVVWTHHNRIKSKEMWMPKIFITQEWGMLHSVHRQNLELSLLIARHPQPPRILTFTTILCSRRPMIVKWGYGGCKTATIYRTWMQELWRQVLRHYRTVRNDVSILGHSRQTRMRGLYTLQLQVDTFTVKLHVFLKPFSGLVRITDLGACFFSSFVTLYDRVEG